MTGRLVAFIEARLHEDEQWAIAASTTGDGVAQGGHHWRWESDHDDQVIVPDPATQEFLNEAADWSPVSLRSVERYPYGAIPGAGPAMPVRGCSEASPAAAGHIIRHDPARVLRDVASGRKILDMHRDCGSGADYCDDGGNGYDDGCPTLAVYADRWSDHADYAEAVADA